MTTYVAISWNGDSQYFCCQSESEARQRAYELFGGDLKHLGPACSHLF